MSKEQADQILARLDAILKLLVHSEAVTPSLGDLPEEVYEALKEVEEGA